MDDSIYKCTREYSMLYLILIVICNVFYWIYIDLNFAVNQWIIIELLKIEEINKTHCTSEVYFSEFFILMLGSSHDTTISDE